MRMREEVKGDPNLTYKEYQAKLVQSRKQNMMMFASIFLVLLIVFLGIAKMMSPDVDIAIGDEAAVKSQEEASLGIDSRLKELQEQDNSAENTESATEEDGLVKIPQKDYIDQIKEDEYELGSKASGENSNTVTTQAPAAYNPNPISSDSAPTSLQHHNEVVQQQKTSTQATSQVTPTIAKTYRVYVGMYSTQAQAEVAKGILKDSGLGLMPNIRQAAGGYTLQVGAFSSKESAQNLSNKLLINNYPARVVSD